MTAPVEPPSLDEQARFEIIMKHGHQDLVQAVAFNAYGDRCATGSVDGKIRVFNRHPGGVWRLCDTWGAHGGEILELQWLPPTIYPNLLASLGIEGRFKMWIEDPAAAPGRRFSQRAKGTNAKAAYETRSLRSPYRSFSLRHSDDTRHTHLALLAADGTLTVLENDQPENLSEFTALDELRVCPRPARGEEASFRVRFDPNPDPCYSALRAGVAADALGLVVAAMDAVKIYRTRPITTASYGLAGTGRAFYLAAEVRGHRGLVRDVAWAPGNFRGYDILATACQDGYVRVLRLDTPLSPDDGKSWAAADVLRPWADGRAKRDGSSQAGSNHGSGHNRPATSALSAAAAKAKAAAEAAAATAAAATAISGISSSASSVMGAPAAASGAGGLGGLGGPGAVSGLAGALSSTGLVSGPSNVPSAVSSVLSMRDADGAVSHNHNSHNHSGAASGTDTGASTRHNSSVASSTVTSFSGLPLAEMERMVGGGGDGDLDGNTDRAAAGLPPLPAGQAADTALSSTSERRWTGEAGQIRHAVRELSKLENHRTPVWRVAFDDDGQILGSVGDDGKLLCYRQTPDGSWVRSSELTVMKMRMTAP